MPNQVPGGRPKRKAEKSIWSLLRRFGSRGGDLALGGVARGAKPGSGMSAETQGREASLDVYLDDLGFEIEISASPLASITRGG